MKNSMRSFSKVLVLALGVIAASPLAAHAQSSTRGKFTVPSETRWGTAVLAPGSYEFLIESANVPVRVMLRNADGNYVGVVIPAYVSAVAPTDSNSLHLESRGTNVFVSSLDLNGLGTELHFSVPKSSEATIASTPASSSAASVVVAAK